MLFRLMDVLFGLTITDDLHDSLTLTLPRPTRCRGEGGSLKFLFTNDRGFSHPHGNQARYIYKQLRKSYKNTRNEIKVYAGRMSQ